MFVDKFVKMALTDASKFMQDSILILPNKANMKKVLRKSSKDPFAGKEMQYITD